MKVATVQNKQFKLLVILICIAIFCLTFVPMYASKYTFYTPDSVGYFGIASDICGKNWNDLLANISTYSYGYALLLSPIIYFFQGTEYVLAAVAVINSIMLCAVFLCTLFCFRRFIENKYWAAGLAVVLTLYSGNVSAAQNYISDILIILLFWAMLLMLIRYIDCPSYFKALGLALITAYLYASHQRTLAVLLAIVMVQFVFYWKKIIPGKYIAAFFVMLISLVLLAKLGYNYFGKVFATELEFDGNSASMRATWFIQEIFTARGIWRVIRNVFGQFYYMFVATLGAFPLGVMIIGIISLNLFKSFIKKTEDKNFVLLECISLFVFLSFLVELGIVCVSINVEYIVHLMFGRYIEFLAMPTVFLLFSVIEKNIIKRKTMLKIFVFFSAFSMISGFLISHLAAQLDNQSLVGEISAIGIAWIGELKIQWEFGVAIIILIGFYSGKCYFQNKQWKKLALIVWGGYFVFSVNLPYKNTIRPEWEDSRTNIEEFTKEIRENDIDKIYWPYYYNTEEMKRLQVLMPEVVFSFYDASDNHRYSAKDKKMLPLIEIKKNLSESEGMVIPKSEFVKIGIQGTSWKDMVLSEYNNFGGVLLYK